MRTLCMTTAHRNEIASIVAPVREQCRPNLSLGVQHPWLRSQGIAADKPLDSVVLQRMRKLSATNKLKKAALVVMAKSLSAVRRHQGLDPCFRSSARPESRQRLYDCLSKGEPGHSITALWVITEQRMHLQDEINGLQQLFQNIDADNSGTITIDELRTALTSCNGKMSVRAAASPNIVSIVLLCKSGPLCSRTTEMKTSAAPTKTC